SNSAEVLAEEVKELLKDPNAYPEGHWAHNALIHQLREAELNEKERKNLKTHLEHPLEKATPQIQEILNDTNLSTAEALQGALDQTETNIGQAEKAIEQDEEEKAEKKEELSEKENKIE